MNHILLMTLGIYIAPIRAQHVCSDDKIFAIAGSNATLEWIIGYSKAEIDTMSVIISNTRGIIIAQVEDVKCEDVNNFALHCEIMHREMQYILSLSFVNMTQANSGNFTGLIKSWNGGEKTVAKQLIVIEKPQVVKSLKPTLDRKINLLCSIVGDQVGAKYRWKLNGSYLNCTERICAKSLILTIEHLRMEDKLNMFSCEVCIECSFCVESEAYMPDPYYGNLKNSEDVQQVPLGIVLVLGGLFLVMVGFVILFKLRGLLTVHQSCAGQVNNEACQEILRFEKQKRPLPIPAMQENVHRSTKRSNYHSIQRKSKSLHELFAHNQDFSIPVRKTLSLQTLIQLSQTSGRRARWDNSVVSMYSFKQNSWSSMEGNTNGIKLDEMHLKGLKGKRVSCVELSTGSKFPSLNISQRGSLDQDPQEDLYNTIDEADLFVYDYAFKH